MKQQSFVAAAALAGSMLLAACAATTPAATQAGPTGSQSQTATTMPAGDMSGMSMTSAAPASGAPASGAKHNSADTAFTQAMIGHHRQAVEMATLAATRSGSTAVKTLARKIQMAQQPEIDAMSGWLAAWGETAPAGGGRADMGDMGDGMMSDADLQMMGSASGLAFDRLFLAGMIAHHQGAVKMALEEQLKGSSFDAIALARTIVADQTTEIGVMRGLLGS